VGDLIKAYVAAGLGTFIGFWAAMLRPWGQNILPVSRRDLKRPPFLGVGDFLFGLVLVTLIWPIIIFAAFIREDG